MRLFALTATEKEHLISPISSLVERFFYTEDVGSSILSSGIQISSATNF